MTTFREARGPAPGLLFIALLAAALAFAALPAGATLPAGVTPPASASSPPGASSPQDSRVGKAGARVSVTIGAVAQKAVATRGLVVRVYGPRGARARLTISMSTFDDGRRPAARPRPVRFGSRASKLRVRLTPAARRQVLAGCSERSFTVKLASGKRSARDSAAMTRTLPSCRLAPVDLSNAAACDWIAQPGDNPCMMPFPSDYYTRPESSSPTGLRLAFTAAGMPKNKTGVPMDPAPYAASDGFSQGQAILVKVPGIDTAADVAANAFVGLDRLSRYAEAGQKALVIDAETGERWPIWVGVDETAADPRKAVLMISPARNFDEQRRYIVALRDLVDGDGNAIEAPEGFRYLRDGIPSPQRQVNQRRPEYERIFRELRKAGVERSSLYLAWDFTVASNENNYRRVISMRDRAFAGLGDTTTGDGVVQGGPPAYTINQVSNVNNSKFERVIRGTFTVPCFLTKGCEPGAIMEFDSQGLPVRQGDYQANFTCMIPQVALPSEGGAPMPPILHGHGLLGTADGVLGGFTAEFAQFNRMVGCATDQIGMADEDIPEVLDALTELSDFRKLPDRLQQGLLDELFLARLAVHPNGFAADPAFQDGGGFAPGPRIIKRGEVFYEGVSQGGILGGGLTAISPDLRRTVLRVGAMNYSTMLTRSSDWPPFGAIFGSSYQDERIRPLALGLMQILWDRGEPNGYAHVMTSNPPPNTPEHTVLKLIALGDHQVTNFASDVQARTVPGMKTNEGAIDPRRWPDYEALWDVPRIKPAEYPYRGSAIVYWDAGPYRVDPADPGRTIGTGLPPYGNVPPDPKWEDPHTSPRDPGPQFAFMKTFLQPDGYILDECAGKPCLSSLWDGKYAGVVTP